MSDKKLILYVCSWACYQRDHQITDVAKLIKVGATDISYAFFNLIQQGAGWVIKSGDEWADFQKTHPNGIAPPDTWTDSESKQAGNFGQLRKLKASGVAFSLQLSVGGWTWSKNFSPAVATNESRQILADSCVQFFKDYPFFDGIDFDWEYLSNDGKNYGNDGNLASPQDSINFKTFILLLRQKLSDNGFSKKITMCVIADPAKAVFPIEDIHPIMDEFRIMTYDFENFAGQKITKHSTNARKSSFCSFSVEQATDFYISRGVPANKLVIGAAYYSRGTSKTEGMNKPCDGISSDFQFAEEVGVVPYHMLPMPGAVEMWDDEAKAGYSYDPVKKIVNSYDTVRSVQEKCKIVNEKGLAGIIVWESAGDTKPDNPRCLTAAMGNYFKGNTTLSTPVTSMPITTIFPAPVQTSPVQTAPVRVSAPATVSAPLPAIPSGSGEVSPWSSSGDYKIGDKVNYNQNVYQALTPHKVLDPNWTPEVASLWKKLGSYAPPPLTLPPAATAPAVPPTTPAVPPTTPAVPPSTPVITPPVSTPVSSSLLQEALNLISSVETQIKNFKIKNNL
jgi:chitinase